MNQHRTSLAWGVASRKGASHDVNEDSCCAYLPVFAVADGMGGHAGGALASTIVTQELTALVGRRLQTQDVVAAVGAASDRITAKSDADARWEGLGTTLAGLALVCDFDAESWLAFNIGDSRIYRLAHDVLVQITVDHSLVQELVSAGELSSVDAALDERRNVLTRALGAHVDADADLWLFTPHEGERFLICSDGVTGCLSNERLKAVLALHSQPQAAAESVVNEAVDAGARDDASAIVIDTLRISVAAPGHTSDGHP